MASPDNSSKVDKWNENKQFESFRRKFLVEQSKRKELIKVVGKKNDKGGTDYDFDIDNMMKLFEPLLQKKQVFNAGKIDEPKRVIGSFKYDFPLFIGSERDFTKSQLMKILFDCWASEKDNSLNIVLNGLNYWLLNLVRKTFSVSVTVNGHAMSQGYDGELLSFDFVTKNAATANKKSILSPLVTRVNIFASSPDVLVRIDNNGFFFVTGEAESDLYEDVRINSITEFDVDSFCYLDSYGITFGGNNPGQKLL